MKRTLLVCLGVLLAASLCFGAERRLIGKEDINWGTGTFQDSIGTTFHQIDNTAAIGYVIGDGITTLTTGNKGVIRVPFSGTIASVTLLCNETGSIVLDIWKDTYANYPPTVADTITAAAKPTISSGNKYTDSTLTGWTKTITSGDIIAFNIDSVSTIKQVTIIITVQR